MSAEETLGLYVAGEADTPTFEKVSAALSALVAERDRLREALEAAERALTDAENIVTQGGKIAWVGSLILVKVHAALAGEAG